MTYDPGSKVKVTASDSLKMDMILCLDNNSEAIVWISMTLGRNAPHIRTMCCVYDPWSKVKVTVSDSLKMDMVSCPVNNS